MRSLFAKRPTAPDGSGDRLLAWTTARAPDGGEVLIGGSRTAAYLPHRVVWHELSSASWDEERRVLDVVETGRWGQRRGQHSLELAEPPTRLLTLFRERITSTIVLQRHVAVHRDRGARVIARRPVGGGRDDLVWLVELDEGIDPDSAGVEHVVAEALALARADLGLS